jgi:hypothetical protein
MTFLSERNLSLKVTIRREGHTAVWGSVRDLDEVTDLDRVVVMASEDGSPPTTTAAR